MALTKSRDRMKEGGVVNVLDYGATGDGGTDDTAALQAALDAAWALGGSKVYAPRGTYNHTGLTIKASGVAPFYNQERIHFYGDGLGVTLFQHTGTGVAVEVVPDGAATSGYGVVIEDMSFLKATSSPTATTNGIELPRGNNYILNRLYIEGGVSCVYMSGDTWLSRFTNLKLSGTPSYGINMAASGTSNFFDQCYVTFSTVAAFKLAGSYSSIGALAADNCSGDYIYQFEFFSGAAHSLGCEGADATVICYGNQTEIAVGHLNIFNAEVTASKGKPISCQTGSTIVDTITIADTGGGGSVAQQLFSQLNGHVQISYVDSDWSFTTQWGNSGDNNGFAIYQNKNAPLAFRQAGARAYLGLDRRGQGRTTVDDGTVYSNAIFMDCELAPRYTSDGSDRRFEVGATLGDWFIELDPAANLVAGYVARATDSDLTQIDPTAIPLILSGTTGERPTVPSAYRTGLMYFDTTLGQPIWWDGSGWVDATGTTA